MAFIRGSLRRPGGVNHKETEADDSALEHMESDKAECEREIRKAVWHVFNSLDIAQSGNVPVSQLKVITANVGMKFAFNKAEELLNLDDVTTMDFGTYYDIVKTKIIDVEKRTSNGMVTFSTCTNEVVKTCFKFCNYERKHKSFTSEHCQWLWRLFNFLSETNEDGDTILPVQLDPEEAALIFREFIELTGQRNKENLVVEFVKQYENQLLTFNDLLEVFEKEFIVGLSMKDIGQGLKPIFDRYILNVMEKGMMWKRGHKHKSWKERWLVLTPTQLCYYVTPKEKIQKGTIVFDSECSVELVADRPSHKPNRFILHTQKKPYEMSAQDLKTKNEWVSALQTALERVGKDPNIQKEAAQLRCCERRRLRLLAAEEERKRREEAELLAKRQLELDEEKRRRLEDEELLKARLGELEAERKKREEAEALWLEEQRLREAEQQRLRELEEIKKELERLLAEERQAKKDEEIVRNLQAKLLEEEFQKREELERLQQQQEEMLKAEREQKAVLEGDRKEQERLLAEAKRRLEELELERLAAEDKMQEAANKLLKAEKDRQIIEEKVKLWKTPVGLARPIQPKVNPLITHRGQGAFCDKDFVRKHSFDDTFKPFDEPKKDDEPIKDKGEKVNENNSDNVFVEDKTEVKRNIALINGTNQSENKGTGGSGEYTEIKETSDKESDDTVIKSEDSKSDTEEKKSDETENGNCNEIENKEVTDIIESLSQENGDVDDVNEDSPCSVDNNKAEKGDIKNGDDRPTETVLTKCVNTENDIDVKDVNANDKSEVTTDIIEVNIDKLDLNGKSDVNDGTSESAVQSLKIS